MPLLSGPQLAHAIRHKYGDNNVRIVGMTGHGDCEKEGIENGMNKVVKKPVGIGDIKQILMELYM